MYDGNLFYSRSGAASQGGVAGESYHTFDDFMSVHHSLFINNHTRNMLIYTQGCTMEYINNYVYNHNIGTYVAQHYDITVSTQLNFIGNRYQRGPSRPSGAIERPLALHEETERAGSVSNAPTPNCLYVRDNLDDYWRPDDSYPEWAVTAWVHWPGYEGYDGYIPDDCVRGFFVNALPELYRAAHPFLEQPSPSRLMLPPIWKISSHPPSGPPCLLATRWTPASSTS